MATEDITGTEGFDPYNCSIEELKEKIEELNDKVGFYETQQLAIKKFINSVYGATASAYFIGFNPNVAEAITLQGQHLNHYSEIAVNEYFKGPFQKNTELHKALGIKTEDTYNLDISKGKLQPLQPLTGPEFKYLNGETESLVVAGDTDSVSGDTIIYVNGQQKTMADAWNDMKIANKDVALKLSNGHLLVVPNNNEMTRSYDPRIEKVVDTPIRYISRHTVRKQKWVLTTKSGKKVEVTNDHSLMVMRDGRLVEIKPYQINPKTDKVVTLKNGRKNS